MTITKDTFYQFNLLLSKYFILYSFAFEILFSNWPGRSIPRSGIVLQIVYFKRLNLLRKFTFVIIGSQMRRIDTETNIKVFSCNPKDLEWYQVWWVITQFDNKFWKKIFIYRKKLQEGCRTRIFKMYYIYLRNYNKAFFSVEISRFHAAR